MLKNMGRFDRILRLIAGPIIFLVAIFAIESTVLSIILAAFGIIFVLTSLTGLCPGYIPFKLNTGGSREKSDRPVSE